VSGIELGRRTDGVELFGVTSPLLTTASGAKMGKTASGAVWLNPDMLSPYDYWQYWRNSEDGDVERFLKLFTELPLKEIGKLAKLKGSELNEAKKILATEATALVHGRDAADRAAETARATFEQGETAASLPTFKVPHADLKKGLGVLNASVLVGFVQSTGEARRQIKGGGLKVNDMAITDERQLLTPSDLTADGVIKLSLGKKRHVLIRPV
jgi:tyrosyl-tRNA synthetase